TPPGAPGAPLDPGLRAGASVRFTWGAAVDAESGIAGYTVEVDRDPAFPGPMTLVTTSPELVFDASTSDGLTLYARVRATNRAGLDGAWAGPTDGVQIDARRPSVMGTQPPAGVI